MKTAIHARWVLIGVLVLASQLCAATATQPAPLPMPADLKAMHDAGEYRTCLQQIARVLMLTGDKAKVYDRYALLLLRGDCLLHLQDSITALDAFTAAEESPDPAQKAEARATALLIRGSAGLSFAPKVPSGAPAVDIVDHEKRKAAMLALMEQEKTDSKTLIDAALDAQTLAPIIAATPTLIDLHDLELTATGSDQQIHGTLLAVGQRARDLMLRELTVIDDRVSQVERSANRPLGVAVGGFWWNDLARQGLTTDNRQALRHDATYADQITSAAGQCQRLSRSLGGTGEKWGPVIERAIQVAQHARDVLMAE